MDNRYLYGVYLGRYLIFIIRIIVNNAQLKFIILICSIEMSNFLFIYLINKLIN